MESIRPHHRLTAALLALLMLFSLAPTALATGAEGAEAIAQAQESPVPSVEDAAAIPPQQETGTEPVLETESESTPPPEAEAEAEPTPAPQVGTDVEPTPAPEAGAEAKSTPIPEAGTEAEPTPAPEATEPEPSPSPSPTPETALVEEEVLRYAPGVLLKGEDAKKFYASVSRSADGSKEGVIAQGEEIIVDISVSEKIESFGGAQILLGYDPAVVSYVKHSENNSNYSLSVNSAYTSNGQTSVHFCAIERYFDSVVLNANEILLSITFCVRSDAMLGSTDFPVEVYDIVDGGALRIGDDIYIGTGTPGEVTVVPGAPEMAFTPSTDTHYEATLSWTALPGLQSAAEGYYKLERQEDNSGNWATLSDGFFTTYPQDDLRPGILYTYRLTPYTAGGVPSYHHSTTEGRTSANGALESFAADIQNSTQILLTWTDNEAARTEGYIVEREAGSSGFVELARVAASKEKTSYEWLDGNAYRGVDFRYRVTPYTLDGKGNIVTHIPSTETKGIPYPGVPKLDPPVKGATPNKVTLQWSAPAEGLGDQPVAGYYIYRKTEAGSWQQIGQTNDTTSYTDNDNILPETSYYYSVQAYVELNGAVLLGKFDEQGIAYTYSLTAPMFSGSKILSANSVELTWTELEFADGYLLYRAAKGESHSATPLAVLPYGTTVYTDDTLTQGSAYEYFLYSYTMKEGARYVAPTQEPATHEVTIPYPSVVQITSSASAQPYEASIEWKAVPDAGDGNSVLYTVYRMAEEDYKANAAANTDQDAWEVVARSNSTSCTDSSAALKPGKKFIYRVQATLTVDGIPLPGRFGGGATVQVARPKEPYNVKTQINGDLDNAPSISISWEYGSDPVDGFVVFRSDGSAILQVANIEYNDSYQGGGLSVSVQDQAVQVKVPYSYTVQAYCLVDGERVWSVDSEPATATITPPDKPQQVLATATSDGISVSWDSVSGANSYYLYRLDGSAQDWNVQEPKWDLTGTSFSDSDGILRGESYTYGVIACAAVEGNDGNYLISEMGVSNTEQALPAEKPANLAVAPVNDGYVLLTWKAPDSIQPAWYGVYREGYLSDGVSQYQTEAQRQLASIPATAVKDGGFSYRDVGSKKGWSYTYTIISYDTSGSRILNGGADSKTIALPSLSFEKGWTLTAIPSDGMEGAGSNAIVLGWTSDALVWPNETRLEGYTVYRKVNGRADSTYVPLGDVEAAASPYTFTDSSGIANTSYIYALKAYTTDSDGKYYSLNYSPASNVAKAGAIGTGSVVIASAAFVNDKTIRIEWEDAIPGAAGYYVYRADAPTNTNALNYSRRGTVSDPHQLYFADTGAVQGRPYYYYVQPYPTTAALPRTITSDAVFAAIPNASAPALSDAVPVMEDGEKLHALSVSWMPLTNHGENNIYPTADGYALFYLNGTRPGALVGTVQAGDGDTCTFTDSNGGLGLKPSTSYKYTVRAYWEAEGGPIYGNYSTTGITGKTAPALAPANLKTETVNATSIQITWDRMDDVSGYALYRSDGSTGTRTTLRNNLGVAVTSYTDTGREAGVEYRYFLQAYVGSITADPKGAEASAAHTIPLLAACENLRVTDSDANLAVLSWDKHTSSDLAGYGIYRVDGTVIDGKLNNRVPAWKLVATVDSSATVYSDASLLPHTSYSFMVKPYAQGSNKTEIWGAESNTVSVTTSMLPAPESLQAYANTATSIKLVWSAFDEQYSGVVTGYNVYRATSDGRTPVFARLGTVAATASASLYSYTDTRAVQGTEYVYKVAAHYNNKQGAECSPVLARVVKLSAVTSAGAVPSSGAHGVGMELSWEYDWNTNNTLLPAGAVHGIHVFAKGGKAALAELPYGSDGYFYHGDLVPNTSYSYDIKPYYIGSDGTPIYGISTTTAAGTTHNVIPVAPGNLRLSPLLNGTQIKLDWEAPEGVTGLNGYKVYRSDGTTAQPRLLATIGNVNTTTYTDKAATPDTPYSYYVVAYRGATLGEKSDERIYTVPLPVQPLLIGEAEVTDAKTIRIRWEPGMLSDGKPADGAAAYRILRRQRNVSADGTPTGAWSNYTTINNRVAVVEGQRIYEYKDSASKTAKTIEYAYTVEAYNTIGNKVSQRNEDGLRAILPALDTPVFIGTPALSDGPVVKLTWAPVAGADGYELIRGSQLPSDGFGTDESGNITYTDSAALGKTAYTYRVRAYQDVAEGGRIYSGYRDVRVTTTNAFAESVSIAGGSYVLTDGTLSLTASLAPVNKTNGKVNWRVEDEIGNASTLATITSDASISTKAMLTAGSAPGLVYVVATAADGGKESSERFMVEIGTGRISIDTKGVTVLSGSQSRTLGVIYEGTDSRKEGALTWSLDSSGSVKENAYAKITDRGVLTVNAKALPEPTSIEVWVKAATSQNTASCAFMLYPEAAKLAIYPSDGSVDHYAKTGEAVQTIRFDLAHGSGLQLASRILDYADRENTALQDVSWKTSSKAIADVDEKGFVTVYKPGTVTITATAQSNTRISANFRLQVYYMDAGTRLSAKLFTDSSAQTLLPGYGLQMEDTAYIAVYGEDLTKPLDPSLFSYEITNAAQRAFVEVLDEPGMVKALPNARAGSATVKVSLKNDPNKRSINVAVKTALVQIGEIGFSEDGSFVEELAKDGYVMSNGVLNVDGAEKNYVFNVRPLIKDTDGDEVSPPPALTYASTNAAVASVRANTDGSATITVRAKASGSVRITATARDMAKVQGYFDMNVCDYAPRLEASRFTINSALSDAVVTTQLRESFGNAIHTQNGALTLHAYNSVTRRYDLPADGFEARYTDGTLSLHYAGKEASVRAQNLQLTVPTDREVYTFILNVAVNTVLPRVTIKQDDAFNLFYRDSQSSFTFTTTETIEKVELADTEHFRIEADSSGAVSSLTQHRIFFTDDLPDALCQKPDTSVTFQVYLKGYDAPVLVKATIRTAKTAPVLLASPATVTLNTKLPQRSSSFTLYENGYDPSEVFDLHAGPINRVDRVDEGSVSYTAKASELTADYDSNVLTLNLTGNAGDTATIYVQQKNWTAQVKLTHRINVTTANPALSFTPASLSLNTRFGEAQAITLATLNQSGHRFVSISALPKSCSIRDAAGKVVSLEEAKAAVAITSDANTGKITTRYTSNDALTGSMVYTFTFKTDSGYTLPKDLTVKLENTLPTVTLRTGTLRFNQQFLGERETAESLLTLNKTGYSVTGVSVATDGYGAKHSSDSGLVRFAISRNRDGMPVLKAQLDPSVTLNPVKGRYAYTLTLTLQNDTTGSTNTVTVKPTVEIYDNAKYSATVRQSGSLDVLLNRYAQGDKLESLESNVLLYSLTALTNISGAVDDVRLVGPDANKFVLGSLLSEDPSVRPAAGLGFVQLGLKQNESYATNKRYSVQLAFSVEGMQTLVYSPVLSISVKQSAARYTVTPATQTFYQGEVTPLRNYQIALSTPAGVDIEKLVLNTKVTPAALLQALGIKDAAEFAKNVSIESDGVVSADSLSSATVSVPLKNPGALVAGRSYSLVLDAYASGQAENLNPIQVRLTVKVMK